MHTNLKFSWASAEWARHAFHCKLEQKEQQWHRLPCTILKQENRKKWGWKRSFREAGETLKRSMQSRKTAHLSTSHSPECVRPSGTIPTQNGTGKRCNWFIRPSVIRKLRQVTHKLIPADHEHFESLTWPWMFARWHHWCHKRLHVPIDLLPNYGPGTSKRYRKPVTTGNTVIFYCEKRNFRRSSDLAEAKIYLFAVLVIFDMHSTNHFFW